ncbi:MAG: major capsid protein P2 [Candidatus Omnitrophica bacterium]|nr:major capsid protein P2 [Candidatus Omnitrophota bacterium]
MIRQLLKKANMNGIAAGAIATGVLPAEGTYYSVFLVAKTAAGVALTRAEILADIGNVKAMINGEEIVNCDVAVLLDLQKYYGDQIGAGNVDGIIPIYFERPHLATDAERSVFALGMANVSSFTLEAAIDGVAQLATLEIFAEVSNENRLLGQHVRLLKYPQSFAQTGDQEITTLPFINDASKAYLALHITAGAGTFNEVTVRIGGNAIFDRVGVNLNKVLLQKDLRNPQTGYYHVDFARPNDLKGLLPMAGIKDFRQTINWITAAPTNFNIYAETLHGLKVAQG